MYKKYSHSLYCDIFVTMILRNPNWLTDCSPSLTLYHKRLIYFALFHIKTNNFGTETLPPYNVRFINVSVSYICCKQISWINREKIDFWVLWLNRGNMLKQAKTIHRYVTKALSVILLWTWPVLYYFSFLPRIWSEAGSYIGTLLTYVLQVLTRRGKLEHFHMASTLVN
jgi:hypothetical protein